MVLSFLDEDKLNRRQKECQEVVPAATGCFLEVFSFRFLLPLVTLGKKITGNGLLAVSEEGAFCSRRGGAAGFFSLLSPL